MRQPGAATQEFLTAWPVLLAATVGIGAGVASTPFYSSGLFLKALEAQFGWSRGAASGGNLALSLGIASAAPLAGRLADRFGARPVALSSMLLLAAGFLLLSRMNGALWFYFTLLFLIGFLAAGSSPVTFTRAVSLWFARARGLALGIALMGTGVTATVAPILLGPLIAASGWRLGYLCLALVALAATPLVLLLRDRRAEPERSAAGAGPGRVPPGRASLNGALRNRRFWILLVTTMMAAFAIAGLAVSLFPMLTDLGASPTVAGRSAGAMGAAIIIGRLATGAAFDRLFAPWVGSAMVLLAAIGCLLLRCGGPLWSLAAAAASFGLALGAEIDLVAYLTARYFGLALFGRVYGLIYGGALVAAGLGPIAAGLAHDRFGDYRQVLEFGALLLAAAAALLPLLGPYPAKAQQQLEP